MDPPSSPRSRRGLGAKGKGRGKAKGKGRGKGKESQIPWWFSQPNIARRSAADGNNPFGEQMCFPRHHPDGGQCTRKEDCWMCHTCPVKQEDGSICGAAHAASAHTPYPF